MNIQKSTEPVHTVSYRTIKPLDSLSSVGGFLTFRGKVLGCLGFVCLVAWLVFVIVGGFF